MLYKVTRGIFVIWLDEESGNLRGLQLVREWCTLFWTIKRAQSTYVWQAQHFTHLAINWKALYRNKPFILVFIFNRKSELTVTIASSQPGVYQVCLRSTGKCLAWVILVLFPVQQCYNYHDFWGSSPFSSSFNIMPFVVQLNIASQWNPLRHIGLCWNT